MKIRHLGCPGHFIGARSFRFRMHTQVGNRFRVSTVGDYFPEKSDRRESLGMDYGSYFETMVFETHRGPDGKNDGCGCRALRSLSALDCDRYATAGAATRGHERIVAKYARKARERKKTR